jgi:uncharacterized protein (TIGR02391 family)
MSKLDQRAQVGQDEPVMFPTPGGARESRAIEAVFSLFQSAGIWPSFEDLDRFLDSRGEPDAEEVLLNMPAGLLYGVGPQSRPIRNDQSVGLTVAGLAACESADEDLSIFLQLLGLAATLEAERQPGEPEPTLTADDAARSLRHPAPAGPSDLLARAGHVLAVEQWGWTQHSLQSDAPSWSFTVDRRVRPFRDVTSIESYWNIAHPEQQTVFGRVEQLAPVAASTSVGKSDWVALLHPSISAVAESRLAAGHDDNAIEEAWKAVAATLRRMSGLSLDGIDLVNQALGVKGPIRLGDLSDMQGRNEHDGFTNLLRGLAQVGRNLRAHRPSDPDVDEAEVAALLLLASICLSRLDGPSVEPGELPDPDS